MTFEKIGESEWSKLVSSWEMECEKYNENFSDYATASIPLLEDLALSAPRRESGVFGLKKGDEYIAICQANATLLPGYSGKVLRIRHIIFAPTFELSDDLSIDEYMSTLIGVFNGVLRLASHGMPADHIKFHLRSPVERKFGQNFTDALKDHSAFGSVEMKGSWIYISK